MSRFYPADAGLAWCLRHVFCLAAWHDRHSLCPGNCRQAGNANIWQWDVLPMTQWWRHRVFTVILLFGRVRFVPCRGDGRRRAAGGVQCHARMIRWFWQLHIALLSIKFHISRRKTIFTVGSDAGLWWQLLVPKFYDGESYPPEKVSLIFYPPHDVAKIQSHTLIILCINQMARLILSRR